MQRMRTVPEAFAEIKADDENTALTLYGLQTLIKRGTIPSVNIGRKRLVNMAVLSDYLRGDCPAAPEKLIGQIRRVT